MVRVRGARAGARRWAPRHVAVLFALLALASADPVRAAEKAIWGPLDLPGGASAFPTYRDLGVDTLQLQVDWSVVAPTRPMAPADPSDPAYRWPAEVERAITEGSANGIQVALLVTGSPGWANGGRSSTQVPDAADFAAFTAAASRRYPTVRRWMIWGEPNRDDRFQPNIDGSPVGARAYAPILDAAYGALKGVSAANVVIGGMTWTGGTVKPAPFLRFMRLPGGRPPRLDWFGHNPFPFRFPDLRERTIPGGWRDVSDLDTFSDQLRRTYGPRARLWLSEFNVLSDKPSRQFDRAVSRRRQADYLTAAFRIADSLPSVAGLGWLALLDESEAPGSSNFGLMSAAGVRKPSYDAYRRAPSVRFRPEVGTVRRVTRGGLVRNGVQISVRARIAGRVTVELRSARGGRIALAIRSARAGRVMRVPVRPRPRRLAPGAYQIVVRSPRGETVRRSLAVR